MSNIFTSKGWRAAGRGNREGASNLEAPLSEIPLRQVVELVQIDLPPEEMEPLLERGVLPGCRLSLARLSPTGDPILRVGGSLLAIRRETARRIAVRPVSPDAR